MIVVVTGMVGIDKKDYLGKFARLAESKGKNIKICNVGNMMYNEAPDVPPGKILDIPMKRLSSLRRSVFKDIIAKSGTCENLIVNTHALFRWRHGLFPAVDFDQMRQLDADMYICLIDGVMALHSRLLAKHPIGHSLKDLIVWREEEMIGTEMLCKGINDKIPFYCLARGAQKETTKLFYKLLFEPETRKAYLSFPITHVLGLEQIQNQINRFRWTMKSHFACFDPGELEESYLLQYAKDAVRTGKDHIELKLAGSNLTVSLEQVRQIEPDINSQIYARDFMLIDQSDMIISYIPHLSSQRAAISSGVERELQHAHEAGKETYVIWTSAQRPSVFVTQTATEVFPDLQTALRFFETKGYINK